ncbi:hypothetical protein C8Q77DRAFT_207647 [Trametes polyzona]|nr:hypothetical protein C8Q77DRAFT_207647 [Trametes polyzona]
MSVLQVALVALSFALSASAQRHRGSRVARIAGGAIAGIVIGEYSIHGNVEIIWCACVYSTSNIIGSVVFVLLLCLCCILLFRRRRARGGQGVSIGSGWNRFGAGGGGPAAQEAGYGPGPGNNAGWNNNAQPAYGAGQYQPPQGPPPGAPQPGGFTAPPGAPPAAHTRPY